MCKSLGLSNKGRKEAVSPREEAAVVEEVAKKGLEEQNEEYNTLGLPNKSKKAEMYKQSKQDQQKRQPLKKQPLKKQPLIQMLKSMLLWRNGFLRD